MKKKNNKKGFTPFEAECPVVCHKDENAKKVAKAWFNAPRELLTGFTLVESMVAITILSTSLAVILGILANSFTFSRFAGDQVTATLLATEGIEYVTNARDNNVQVGNDWLTGIPSDGSKFRVDPLDPLGTFVACAADCPVLKFDASSNYTYQSGTATRFYREITVTKKTNNGTQNEIVVTVTVYWPDSSRRHQVRLIEHLFSWNDFTN